MVKKTPEIVKINLNGVWFQIEEKHVMGTVLEMFIFHLQYMSFEAQMELLASLTELLLEVGVSGNTKTQTNKMAKYVDNAMLRYNKAETDEEKRIIEENLTYSIINIVLRKDGMSTLPGFGYAAIDYTDGRRRVTGIFNINPERTLVEKL